MIRIIPIIYFSAPIPAEFKDLSNQTNTALDQVRIVYPGQTGKAPVFQPSWFALMEILAKFCSSRRWYD
jgi:hypothetical protein